MARRIRRRRATTKYMRVVDNTGQSVAKRITIYQKDHGSGYADPPAWKDIVINQSNFTFGFDEPLFINVYKNGYLSPLIPVITGKRYRFETGEFVESGSADSGIEIKFENNGSGTLTVLLSKDGNLVDYKNITANQSWSYEPRKTFWIHAIEDLNASVPLNDVNTEISYLGVASADVRVNKSGDVYSFSLANII